MEDEDGPPAAARPPSFYSNRHAASSPATTVRTYRFATASIPTAVVNMGARIASARITHEYLGFNAGLDFETKIVVKENAVALFRAFLARDTWKCEPVVFSGVTDCYQPAERRFRLTRACLEVAVEARQPIGIITKNALVLRDLDLLRELAANNLVHVTLAVTTLDAALARSMGPPPALPPARLRTLTALAECRRADAGALSLR